MKTYHKTRPQAQFDPLLFVAIQATKSIKCLQVGVMGFGINIVHHNWACGVYIHTPWSVTGIEHAN